MRRGLLLAAVVALLQFGSTGHGVRAAQTQSNGQKAGIMATTVAYVAQFYPLWFTYYQSLLSQPNQLIGPVTISPAYQSVVAINNDTLYASTFVDLSAQPLVLTIPATTVNYSILTLDPYGNIIQTSLVSGQPGVYLLTGPGWTGTPPPGATAVPVPLNHFMLIFRVDKFTPDGVDETTEEETFRESLKAEPLIDYQNNPTGGSTKILPVEFFAGPFKTVADNLIAKDPIIFLRQLQKAVAYPQTPPLTPYEQKLSNSFDKLFGAGVPIGSARTAFAKGAQAAHALIINRYLTHTDAHNWINFTNIGIWGGQVIDRSAITEFIQFANGHSTSAYYQTFKDRKGRALTGNHPGGYILTFRADQVPSAKRFWSVTAYTPHAIELIPNPANKYEVASYTQGLVKGPHGSVTIYIAQQLPAGVPEANWLPVSSRSFNLMLRVYGPEGSVAAGTYVPPAVIRVNGRASH